MKPKNYSYLLLIFFSFISCKKEHNASPGSTADIYVVGTIPEGTNGAPIAVYWKNGNLVKLPGSSTSSQATSICVAGNDIYIAGYISHAPIGRGEIQAVYWKNGVLYKLGRDTTNSKAYSVAVNGNDVYIAGEDNILFTNDPAYDPNKPANSTIWKNSNESFSPLVSLFRKRLLQLHLKAMMNMLQAHHLFPMYGNKLRCGKMEVHQGLLM